MSKHFFFYINTYIKEEPGWYLENVLRLIDDKAPEWVAVHKKQYKKLI